MSFSSDTTIDLNISSNKYDDDNEYILDYELKISELEVNNLKKEIKNLEIELEKLPKVEIIEEEKKESNKEDFKYNNIICYYINLEKRLDRKNHIENELLYIKNLFKYKRFNAIDANNLDIKTYIRNNTLPPNPRWDHNPFKRGHLACMLSHLNSWKKFLTTKYEYLIILEDDIIINKQYFDIMFPKIMDNIKKINFDWLYLGRQSLGHTGFYSGEQYNIFYKPLRTGVGNHAYMLSKEGAKNLVKYLETSKTTFFNTIGFKLPPWPMDKLDVHKKFYLKYMYKELQIFSIIPENFDKKKLIPSGQHIQSKSTDFLFYAKNWSDSDTRVL